MIQIGTADITPSDGAHLTIAGLGKQAALEWRILALEHEETGRRQPKESGCVIVRSPVRSGG